MLELKINIALVCNSMMCSGFDDVFLSFVTQWIYLSKFIRHVKWSGLVIFRNQYKPRELSMLMRPWFYVPWANFPFWCYVATIKHHSGIIILVLHHYLKAVFFPVYALSFLANCSERFIFLFITVLQITAVNDTWAHSSWQIYFNTIMWMKFSKVIKLFQNKPQKVYLTFIHLLFNFHGIYQKKILVPNKT